MYYPIDLSLSILSRLTRLEYTFLWKRFLDMTSRLACTILYVQDARILPDPLKLIFFSLINH